MFEMGGERESTLAYTIEMNVSAMEGQNERKENNERRREGWGGVGKKNNKS